jgi:short-subunit dehydrogenase
MNINGMHVVVTGGSRGVGPHIARAMIQRDAKVTVVARNATLLAEVGAELGAAAVPVDLSDFDAVDTLLPRAEQANGPVDVLINNAAINIPGALVNQGPGVIRTVGVTNLLTPLELCRQALAPMLERGYGAVVNISSLAGELAMRNVIPYSSSKAGLTIATRALQRELRGTGVTAHLAVLGVVDTEMIGDTNKDPVGAQIAGRFGVIPIKDPREVGERIVTMIERNQKACVIPAVGNPFHRVRLIPSRIADAILVGSPPSLPQRNRKGHS